jgi:hypothetical protein
MVLRERATTLFADRIFSQEDEEACEARRRRRRRAAAAAAEGKRVEVEVARGKRERKQRGRLGHQGREQESVLFFLFSLRCHLSRARDARHARLIYGSAKRGRHDEGASKAGQGEKRPIAYLLSSLVASSTISLLGDFLRSRMAVVKSFLGAPAAPPSTEGFLFGESEWVVVVEKEEEEEEDGVRKRGD